MNFNNLKGQINSWLKTVKFDNSENNAVTNSIITGCLLYELISSALSSNTAYENNVSTLLNNYGKQLKSSAENMQSTYISYDEIQNNLTLWGYTSFSQLSLGNIEKILALTKDKSTIEAFNTEWFSPRMYRVGYLGNIKCERLAKIHRLIMTPIAKYAAENYGSKQKDVSIISANGVSNNPGKEIEFRIKDVDNALLLYDINNSIGIAKYLNYAEISGKNIKISVK